MDTFETRKNGCDIIPPIPAAEILEGKAEKSGNGGWSVPDREEEELEYAEKEEKSSPGIFSFAVILICALAVLWIYSMSSPFLASAMTATGWKFWFSLGAGIFPPVAAIAIILVAVLKFRRVPKIERFDLSARSVKSRLRKLIAGKYISKFPDPEKYVRENGFGKENGTGKLVEGYLRRLKGIDDAGYSDAAGWMADFEKFNSLQKERAEQIAAVAWKRVWLSTSASPWKIIDMICVLHHSTAMITAIGKVFNRRTTSREAFRLAARWALNIYLSGEMGEWTSKGADTAFEGWKDTASSWIATALKPLSAAVGKVAEGGINAFLVNRLGRKAIDCFNPVVRRK